ncbi:carbohydrate ABC transporter permease, partial [Longispora fulva]
MTALRPAGVAEVPRGGVGGGDEPSPTARRSSARTSPLPYVLIAPVILFIAGLALVPAVFTIVQSFFTVNALDPPTRFSGLDNFRALAEDAAIRSSIANTALYVVIGVTLSTVLGIAMAILLQRPFRGRSLVIAVLILPWALPGVVEGILWSGIFDPNAGLVSSLMGDLGLG